MRALSLFVAKLALTAAFAWVLLTFVIGIYPVHGNAMYPAVLDGDLVLTERLGKAQIGDVVLYRYLGKVHQARVIGASGDELEITENGIFLNGMSTARTVFYDTSPGSLSYPIEVSPGEVFLLNDYREDLEDSRSFGCIRESDLQGKVFFLFRRRGI